MEPHAAADQHPQGSPTLSRLLGFAAWGGVASGLWLLSVLLLQVLFGRQLERLQTLQLSRELALNLRLTELTLERYPPSLIHELTGLDLTIAVNPPTPSAPRASDEKRRDHLRQELCTRLNHCPRLQLAKASGVDEGQQVWIEVVSPLEPVWLRSELPALEPWPPDPTLILLALIPAVLSSAGIYLLLEVERPLQKLERALAGVENGTETCRLPERGAPVVQRMTHRFNAMVMRLTANRRERETMLAGIAHDLRAPITRLQFRLSLQQWNPEEERRCQGDLQALERITGQFLLYAGGGQREEPVSCPLDQWLSETLASHSNESLQLQLAACNARIRPVALGRAINNLVDNALDYGTTPVVVRLRNNTTQACIEIWDQGNGIPESQWVQALQPFQRLDVARGGSGHCGLGLAIVNHVIQLHDGSIRLFQGQDSDPGRFGVVLQIPINGPISTQVVQKS